MGLGSRLAYVPEVVQDAGNEEGFAMQKGEDLLGATLPNAALPSEQRSPPRQTTLVGAHTQDDLATIAPMIGDFA